MSGGGERQPGLLIRRRSRKARVSRPASSPARGAPPTSDAAPASAGTAPSQDGADGSPTDAEDASKAAESPAASDADAPDSFLIVARALRPHGTQGEIACEIVTEFPQRFRRTNRVFLTPPAGPGRGEPLEGATPRPFGVKRARVVPHRGHAEVILSLEGVADRDAAEAFRGWLVQVPEDEAWRLPRGRYYWHQIVGLRVVTTEGEEIGTVSEILETGANDVYVVRSDSGERLIPAIKQIVKEIAPERGEMVVSLIPGL